MKILKWGAAALVLLLLVMLANMLSFTREQVSLEPLLDDSAIDRDAVASRLSRAIQHETVSYLNSEKIKPENILAFHEFLETSFPKVHSTLLLEKVNELSLLYLWQGSDASLKPMLLMSHQDVVPAYRERWSHPPFAGEISDGIIWGRGAIDIKSGVLGALEAVEDLIGKGFQPKRSLYLAFGHDEEIGGEQGAKKIAALFKERNIDFEFILDEGGSIVSGGIIPGMKVPVALVGMAEKGYVSLELSTYALGGHSSMPPKHSALGVIAKALVDLENNPFPANLEYSKKLFNNIGPAMGFVKKMVFANMWLTEPLVEKILSESKATNAGIRTTTAVTMAIGSSKDNVLPSKASAIVNFRIMPGESVQSVTEYVKQIISNDDIEIKVAASFVRQPSSVSVVDNDSFKLIKNSIYRVTQDADIIVSPYLVMGGTDATHYSGLSDSIYRFAFNRFKPDTLSRMHGIDEQIKVDDYVDVVKFYRELILGANR